MTIRPFLAIILCVAPALGHLFHSAGNPKLVYDPAKSCQGLDACKDAWGIIGDGSCNGDNACNGFFGKIGKDSCNGNNACREAAAEIGDKSCISGQGETDSSCGLLRGLVGAGSCIGTAACRRYFGGAGRDAGAPFVGVNIGNGSCKKQYSCAAQPPPTRDPPPNRDDGPVLGLLFVGHNSCTEVNACMNFAGQIGSHSCQGESSCHDSFGGVGDYSCHEVRACKFMGELVYVGSRSCVGFESCLNVGLKIEMGSAAVGDDSCRGTEACKYMWGAVSNNACIGASACESPAPDQLSDGLPRLGYIDYKSCQGERACNNADKGVFEHDSCNGKEACCDSQVINVGHNGCNGERACYDIEAWNVTDEDNGFPMVGDNACVGVNACASTLLSQVEANSCHGDRTCSDLPDAAKVGECSCNGGQAGDRCDDPVVGDDEQNNRNIRECGGGLSLFSWLYLFLWGGHGWFG